MSCLLAKQTSISLKGVLALMILIHHIYQQTLFGSKSLLIDYVLRSFGYWGVSAFFMLSGYGLMFSLRNGGGYSNKLKKKCRNLYFLTIFLVLLYWLVDSCFNVPIDTNLLIKSFVFGGTIVGGGWYLQVTLVIYLAFYFLEKFDSSRIVLYMTIFVSVLIVLMMLAHMSIHWYISLLALPLGMTLYLYENKLISFITRNYFRVLTSVIVLFSLATICIISRENSFIGKFMNLLSYFTQGIWFSLLIILILQKININNRISNLLGNYSLEIFLLQGISFVILRNNVWCVTSTANYILLSFLITMFLSYLFKPLFDKILVLR